MNQAELTATVTVMYLISLVINTVDAANKISLSHGFNFATMGVAKSR